MKKSENKTFNKKNSKGKISKSIVVIWIKIY